jgi:(p)ppGpp synthase/HD superfamily hydrolase
VNSSTQDSEIKAVFIAIEAHRGQYRRDGDPYISHPTRVAENFPKDSTERIVAWLHDVVEDSTTTLEDLKAEFSATVVDAVDAITHREGEPYLNYLLRLAKNPVARQVKEADLKDNLSGTPGKNSDKHQLALWILSTL